MQHTNWCYHCGIGQTGTIGLQPIAEGFAHPKCIDAVRRSPANLEARIIALEQEIMKMAAHLASGQKRGPTREQIDA